MPLTSAFAVDQTLMCPSTAEVRPDWLGIGLSWGRQCVGVGVNPVPGLSQSAHR